MAVSGMARAAINAAVAPYEYLTTTPTEALTRYVLDPWAHCDDGHVLIPDLVTMEEVEFHPWPHQRAFAADWIDLELLAQSVEDADAPLKVRLEFRNVLEEKSRQMGMSWALAYLVWWILSHHEAPGGYQHLDINEVDNGGRNNSIKSFFGRVRYINDHVEARWRAPLQFRGGNAPEIKHAYKARAFVLGEGATADPARGQRLRWFVQDEAARIPHDKAATAALSRSVPSGRVMNSTPKGEDNEYFRIRDSRPADWRIRRDHWSDHPVYGAGQHVAGSLPKTCALCRGNVANLPWSAEHPLAHRYPGKLASPWYDDAVLGLTDDQVAMELDIDYAGSLSTRVYPEFREDTHVVWEAEIAARGLDPVAPYDENLPLELSWDYGIDTTAVGIWQDALDEYRKIGEVEMHDSTPEEVVGELLDRLADLGVPMRLLEPQWTIQMLAVGDPAGESRQMSTGKPLTYDYRRVGFHIRSKPRRIAQTINAVKRLLNGTPKRLVYFGPTCPESIRHIKSNSWPVDREGNRKSGAAEPLNDEHNHMMRADAYLITWKFPPTVPSSGADAPDDPAGNAARNAARRVRAHEVEQPVTDPSSLSGGGGTSGIGYDTSL